MVNQLSREVDGQYYLCFTLRQAMTSCFAISPVVATLKLHVFFSDCFTYRLELVDSSPIEKRIRCCRASVQ